MANAFNSVHREALRTAAEQVLLRAGVGATFVALARRGERLTGALTSELDRAERSEQDPDRLARLFSLDHLAARMARNNESLLVLGGEGSARVRERAVMLLDVVRAALGRIERYTRVDLENIDPAVLVAPHAVDHLVHLCAELLDNATTFSAPDSRVTVGGHRMTDRVVIQIADRGMGMTPARRAELNTQLAAPRQVDSETVRAMGLTVVGAFGRLVRDRGAAAGPARRRDGRRGGAADGGDLGGRECGTGGIGAIGGAGCRRARRQPGRRGHRLARASVPGAGRARRRRGQRHRSRPCRR